MSRWFASLLLSVLMVLPYASAWAENVRPQLQERGLNISREGAHAVLFKEAGAILPVQNSVLRAVQVLPEEASQYDLEPGLYLFEPNGAPVSLVPDDSGVLCAAVSLSPDGKVLAVDSGTWVIRAWTFYTYPALKNLGGFIYRDEQKPLLWFGSNTVLLHTQEDVDQRRQCDYDPCGPISVERVDVWPLTSTPLFKGTDLCDFTLERLDGNTLTVNQTCASTIDGWAQESDAGRTRVSLTKTLTP